ncbi:DUF4214 domain-containing protein [Pararhizobium haloflavum]|uniref:DUF4214 domain-containing protein n=1 Tax=Pararhizobium haloflavum TaxID=2037914 RepID=UPI0018E4342E|nr:DUF4214 domain-containing protein [Pararhizobium haloflavum]
MAQLTLRQPFDIVTFDGFNGEIIDFSATRITESDGVSLVHYEGSFGLTAEEEITGTLTGIEYFDAGVHIFSADQLRIDATEFAYLIDTDQIDAAVDLVLGGDDTIIGSGGKDVMASFGGNDTIQGNGGDDQFLPGMGSNFVDGGAGTDTVLYEGVSSDFDITIGEDAVTVSNNVNIEDRLVGVERLAFTDGFLAVDLGGNAGKAFRIYEAAFDRAPGAPEVGYWMSNMDTSWSLEDVAARFMDTAEFAALYGDNPTNAELVDRIYFNVLDRKADAGGAAYWESQLDAGAMSQAEVLARISESPENIAGVLPQIEGGIWYSV